MGNVHWMRKVAAILCALVLCGSCMLPAYAEEAPAHREESADALEPPHSEEVPSQPEEGPDEGEPSEPEEAPGEGTPSDPEETPDEGEPSQPGEDSGEDPAPSTGESYTVTLGSCRIGAGEIRSYTTISSEFAGEELPEDYYPGALTVEIIGEIVVDAGGSLGIGTLSVGGPEEHPVLTGSGQIVVKAGGSLRLTGVSLEGSGEGPMIVQEPGGSVILQDTEAEDGLVQWSSPLVDNLYNNPDDLWLEAGTVLTPEMLPDVWEADVLNQGTAEYQSLTLRWDLSTYDGRTDGELTLTGEFQGADGLPLLSIVPLELTIHWYTPETLTVTDAVWKGDTVPTAQLTVQNLPEFADVWGEVSTDGGNTWTRWDDPDVFFIVAMEYEENLICVFQLPDETPRWFRIAAHDPLEHLYWRSDTFYLYHEDEDDSGGNRGGSTTPSKPDREPTPPEDDAVLGIAPPEEPAIPDNSTEESAAGENTAAAPESTPAEDTPASSNPPSVEAAASTPEPEAVLEPETQADTETEGVTAPSAPAETAAAPQTVSAHTETEESVKPTVSAELPAQKIPQEESALPKAAQILLVTAGIAVSITAAAAAARIGPFRKRS